jgi:hypothetical protein
LSFPKVVIGNPFLLKMFLFYDELGSPIKTLGDDDKGKKMVFRKL